MDVNQRLKYLDNNVISGVYVRAIIESPSMGIGWVEKFKVSSIENAEEDVCEILFRQNEQTGEHIKFIKICK